MFSAILRSHLKRYPRMQIQDVYKLVHQAAMGSEHAGISHLLARSRLEFELADMVNGYREPLMDPISVDGEILRVHLRPFLSSGGNLEMLLEAFIRTSCDFQGDSKTLEAYWNSAVQTNLFPAAAMQEYLEIMKAYNYPAAHHSDIYRQAYKPAYRVVWRKYFSAQEIGG